MRLQQFDDGVVLVVGEAGEYRASAADFAADYGAPAPALPAGAITRIYRPGEQHHTNSGDTAEPGPLTWPDGDAILAALPQLLAARETRENPPPTLAEVRAAKRAELSVACRSAITGGFDSEALGAPHRYDSGLEDQINLVGAASLGTAVDYACTDVATSTKAARPHTAAQIKQVLADGAAIKIALLAQYRARVAAVEAAETEAEVEAVVW